MTETEFMGTVIELARLKGWLVAHFRPAETKKGWRTAVSADGAGFPDLVLARDGRILFVELKSDAGKLSTEQTNWLVRLGGLVWRPKDWEEIVGELE